MTNLNIHWSAISKSFHLIIIRRILTVGLVTFLSYSIEVVKAQDYMPDMGTRVDVKGALDGQGFGSSRIPVREYFIKKFDQLLQSQSGTANVYGPILNRDPIFMQREPSTELNLYRFLQQQIENNIPSKVSKKEILNQARYMGVLIVTDSGLYLQHPNNSGDLNLIFFPITKSLCESVPWLCE